MNLGAPVMSHLFFQNVYSLPQSDNFLFLVFPHDQCQQPLTVEHSNICWEKIDGKCITFLMGAVLWYFGIWDLRGQNIRDLGFEKYVLWFWSTRTSFHPPPPRHFLFRPTGRKARVPIVVTFRRSVGLSDEK